MQEDHGRQQNERQQNVREDLANQVPVDQSDDHASIIQCARDNGRRRFESITARMKKAPTAVRSTD